MTDPRSTVRHRLAVDIGGTFTDFVIQDSSTGVTRTGKVLSTPANPARAVVEGIRRLVSADEEIAFLVHGTTVGLNATLERRGAPVALVTTAGFRDVYLIGGNDRQDLFSLQYRKPKPLVEPDNIFTVRERVRWDGSVQEPIHLPDLDVVVEAVQRRGLQAVAVAFLFSYVNPEHELTAAEYLQQRLPQVAISTSHALSPEWREYARTSTAVMNAYIAPVVTTYLSTLIAELEQDLGDVPLHVMQSNGGAMTARAAREIPIQTMLSGPVGGAIGAQEMSAQLGRPNLICIDMGGTSFDASLVVDSRPSVSSEASLEGLPIQMSVVDIHVIGAGGGSVAWLEAGALRVGPRSAGADPGPACYGNGGSEPTVTDANLVLGRVDERRFAGGGMRLDVTAARSAMSTITPQLGMTEEQLASGILDIVNAKMADAIRTITVRRGIDPRQFSLVAYGGAGPMQAVFLAEQLDIAEVIVPTHPGTFSAWGMLQTDIRHDLRATFYRPYDQLDVTEVTGRFKQLEEDATSVLRGERVADQDMQFRRSVDMRYVGQEYSLNVPLAVRNGFDAEAVRGHFDEMYQQRYGHSSPDAPVELVNLRVAALGRLARPTTVAPEAAQRAEWPTRRVHFGDTALATRIVARDEMTAADELNGPIIVEESTATTVVPPGWRARVVDGGHLSIVKDGA